MKFDVVIGNPPYNNGMDIDFIDTGFRLSKAYTCMITPAKWQTAEYNQAIESKLSYGGFRELYSQYIREVVFYPCCRDIFSIDQADGITFFIMDKEKHAVTRVVNKSKHFTYLNSVETRSIDNGNTLVNIGNDIVNYLGDYKRFTFDDCSISGRYKVWMNIKIPAGGLATVESNRPVYFVGSGFIEDSTTEVLEKTPAYKMVFASDNIFECESFLSWIQTRFVGFFIAINVSKLTGIFTNHYFRYVPYPKQGFTIKYSDDILYKQFKLTNEHIKQIESMVKSRI